MNKMLRIFTLSQLFKMRDPANRMPKLNSQHTFICCKKQKKETQTPLCFLKITSWFDYGTNAFGTGWSPVEPKPTI